MQFKDWLSQDAIIYLDLDNTLVDIVNGQVVKRPYADEFIRNLQSVAKVCILTHGHSADKRILAKQSGIRLPVIGREDYNKIIQSPNAILIDNRSSKSENTKHKLKAIGIGPDRCVKVPTWKGNKNDRALQDILPDVVSKIHTNEWTRNDTTVADKEQTFKTYAQARSMAEERKSKFKEGMEKAAKSAKVVVSIKTERSFNNKTEERGKDPKHVFDVLRGAILVDDDKEIKPIVQRLMDTFKAKKVEGKDKPDGRFGYYGSTHVDVIIDDMVCEIQIMTKKLWDQKLETDKIYKKYRGKVAPPEEVQKSKKLFKKANNDMTEGKSIIRFISWMDDGTVTAWIDGKRYDYQVDPIHYERWRKMARFRPGSALNEIKRVATSVRGPY